MTEQQKQEALINKDAKNRALRTFLQNIGFDIGAALVVVLYAAFSKANGWGDFEWALLSFTLIKTTVVTGLSYLMRKVFTGVATPPQ